LVSWLSQTGSWAGNISCTGSPRFPAYGATQGKDKFFFNFVPIFIARNNNKKEYHDILQLMESALFPPSFSEHTHDDYL
jgi:hypothetical protein